MRNVGLRERQGFWHREQEVERPLVLQAQEQDHKEREWELTGRDEKRERELEEWDKGREQEWELEGQDKEQEQEQERWDKGRERQHNR